MQTGWPIARAAIQQAGAGSTNCVNTREGPSKLEEQRFGHCLRVWIFKTIQRLAPGLFNDQKRAGKGLRYHLESGDLKRTRTVPHRPALDLKAKRRLFQRALQNV